jgi:hypothetical protein
MNTSKDSVDNLFMLDQLIPDIEINSSGVDIPDEKVKDIIQNIMTSSGFNVNVSSEEKQDTDKTLEELMRNYDNKIDPPKKEEKTFSSSMFDDNIYTKPKQSSPVEPRNLGSMPKTEHDKHNIMKSLLDDYEMVKPTHNIINNKPANALTQSGIGELLERQNKYELRDLIMSLRYALENEGEKVDDIPIPSNNDSIDYLENIHRILDKRYNRKLDYETGENIILAGAKKVEDFFNGKRDFFGSKPNLRGLKQKTQRIVSNLKLETANEVSRLRNKYFPGYIGRLIMNIVPAAYLLAGDNDEKATEEDKYTVSDSEYNSKVSNF